MQNEHMKHNERGAAGKAFILWLLGVPVSIVALLWIVGILR